MHSCVAQQDYYGGNFAADGEDGANYAYYGGEDQYNYNGNEEQAAEGDNQANQYQNGQNGNGYYNNEQRNDYQGMYQQQLVTFKLCPSDSCGKCKNGAEYVVELNDFLDAFLEAKMTAQEYNCEHVRENCWCENAYSKESCEDNCYKNAGIEGCAQEENKEEFDVQEALECAQIEVDEDAARSYYYNNMKNEAAAGGYYAQNGQQEEEQDIELFVGPCKF